MCSRFSPAGRPSRKAVQRGGLAIILRPSVARSSMHKAVVACIAVGAALADSSIATAQNFPSRPIELVVPLAPGSTTDIASRLIAQHASETLGQQIVVINKTGAGIALGAAAVAKAPPDGYTILMATVGLAVDRILKPVN